MKIALAHFRVGETDGISLEMEKWKDVLKRMGHQVLFLGWKPTVEKAAEEMAEILTDADRYTRTVQHNFQIGKTNFSNDSLRQLLQTLIEEVNRWSRS